jgi:hypothetical protein
VAEAKRSFLVAAFIGIGLTAEAQAVCPVCTVAVSTGVGLSRWLGVDDTITGLWIGGVIVSLIVWSTSWMADHNIRLKRKGLIAAVSWYMLICAPLYLAGVMGNPNNTLAGIDKLALGIIVGSAAFYAGTWAYEWLKEMNKGHSYFPFQKVVMPVVPLIILSPVFYLVTRGS